MAAAQTVSVLGLSTSPSLHSTKCVRSSNSVAFPRNLNSDCAVNSFLGQSISISPSNLWSLGTKRKSLTNTILFSLPTASPERDSTDTVPKWSSSGIKSFAMSELEARKLKYPNTGTEALLMGILVEGTNFAAKFLRANGITLLKVREESIKLLGKSDMYYFSPEHPPLCEAAQRALDWAVDEKLKSGESGEITTTHLLLGIWLEKESAGYKIMASLGFDDEKANELKKSVNEE